MVMTLGFMQKKTTFAEVWFNWIVVFVTNAIGGIIVAYFFRHIVGLTEGQFLEKTLAVAQSKTLETPLVAFISGIGCNIFVCLAVYLGAMGKTYLGKMFGLWFPVMVFVVCSFQHVVANAFIIPAAIFSNESSIQWLDFFKNTIFVFLGNVAGGSLFFAVPLMYLNAEKKQEVSVESVESGELYEEY